MVLPKIHLLICLVGGKFYDRLTVVFPNCHFLSLTDWQRGSSVGSFPGIVVRQQIA